MATRKTTISLSNLLNGKQRVKGEVVTQFNQRINERMKVVVRDLRKKERISIEKASRIVLNA